MQREIAPGLVFSGTAARVVAFWVDAILLALIGGVVSASLGTNTGFTGPTGFVWTANDFIATVINVAINGAYFIGFWSGGRRATLGQMLFKIQVGNAFDGRSLTTEQAVRRWLGLGQFLSAFAVSASALGIVAILSAVWSLILLISTATSPTKQGLHDKFANTAVVRPADAGNGLIYACLFTLIVILVLVPLAILSLIMIGGQVSTILSSTGTPVQP